MKSNELKNKIILINLIIFTFSLLASKNHKNINKKKIENNYYKNIFGNLFFLNISIYLFFDFINFNDERNIVLDFIILSVLYDTWLYWSHRSILHRTKYFRNNIHVDHHSKIVIPSDWLNVNFFELIIQTLGIFLPVYFFKFNSYSLLIFIIIKQLFEVYIHSDVDWNLSPLLINSKFHATHHEKAGCNYSQFYIFWDTVMKTKK